jgi:hypothetical protein
VFTASVEAKPPIAVVSPWAVVSYRLDSGTQLPIVAVLGSRRARSNPGEKRQADGVAHDRKCAAHRLCLRACVWLVRQAPDRTAEVARNHGPLASAPVEEEEVTPETAAAIGRSRASIAHGEGIRHEDILREFGLGR